MSLEGLIQDLQKNSKKAKPTSSNSLVKNVFCPVPTKHVKKTDQSKKEWFEMGSSRMTEDLKRDIQFLNIRNAMDTTHNLYKPTTVGDKSFVQYGTVIESPFSFYSSGASKSKKKPKAIVDSLLQDEEFRAKIDKKYAQIKGEKRHFKKRTWSK